MSVAFSPATLSPATGAASPQNHDSGTIGAATGSLIGGALHDLTGGYRAGFIFSLCAIVFAVAPFWTVRAMREDRSA